jgi:hypothetical protein
MLTTQETQLTAQKEVDEIMLEMWLEHADRAVLRFIDGVSAILGLRRDELIRYMPEFLPTSLLRNISCRQDAAFAAESAVERIYKAFADHEAWDSYYASHAPSAYRFAAATASWTYLFAYHYGNTIPIGCPLFGEAVRAAVVEFLATKTAYPISDAVSRIQVDRCRVKP